MKGNDSKVPRNVLSISNAVKHRLHVCLEHKYEADASRVVDILGDKLGRGVGEGCRVERLLRDEVAEDEARADVRVVEEDLDLVADTVEHGLAHAPAEDQQTHDELETQAPEHVSPHDETWNITYFIFRGYKVFWFLTGVFRENKPQENQDPDTQIGDETTRFSAGVNEDEDLEDDDEHGDDDEGGIAIP